MIPRLMKGEILVKTYQMYIDGAWTNSQSSETKDVINPTTEEVIAKVPIGNKEDANKAVAAARKHIQVGMHYLPKSAQNMS